MQARVRKRMALDAIFARLTRSGEAIRRSISALPYHITFDTLSAMTSGDELRCSDEFALAGSLDMVRRRVLP